MEERHIVGGGIGFRTAQQVRLDGRAEVAW